MARPAAPAKPPAAAKAQPPAAQAPAPSAAPAARGRPQDDAPAPIVAQRIFVLGFSDGPTGSQDAIPFHEVVLLRRKLGVFGQQLTLLAEWPEHSPRERGLTAAGLQEEHKRLKERYTFLGNDSQPFDLVLDIYGPAHQGRLLAVLRKQAQAYARVMKQSGGRPTMEDLEEIARLADPEADFIEADPDSLIQA